MTEPANAPPTRRALLFILITVVLDTISFGIIAPVMPELIMELTGEGLGRAAIYGGWLLFLYALIQFFFAPVLGNLSDRFGRRPVLLASLFAFGIDYLIMGYATSLLWLFVGRALAGVAGATHSTANAYVADVTPPEQRAQNFGLIGVAWGLGFILGPVIGGLLGSYGPRVPFFAAAGLAFANCVYGAFVLPETLAPSKRRPFSMARANPIGALIAMRQFPLILGLFGVLMLYQVAHDSLPSTWTYYTMLKFDWTERDVGLSMGLVGLMIMLVMGGLIRLVIPRIGEHRAVYLGLMMMASGFIGFAFASQSWIMVAFIVPFSLGGFAMPALRSIMSNQVPENAQGELQGAIASLFSLTAIGAPVLMTQLFGVFTSATAPLYFPGISFFTAGSMLLGAVILFSLAVQRAARSAAHAEV